MSTQPGSAAARILHNSFWYGLEQVLETIVFFGTSIAVARYLGPTKLGYFSYINFFVAIVTRTSGNGLATATRKYMTEYLGQDRPGTARAVYYLAYKYQLLSSIFITLLGLAAVALFVDPGYKLMSNLLILAIVPGVMSWVPAQANQAFEDVAPNTFSALAYIASYGIVIALTLHYKWDLVGIASAQLLGRVFEVILRTVPLHRRLRHLPLEPLEPELIGRLRSFCLNALGIQLLMSVVWDRSEMVFLKWYSGLEQIAFYSVSFGLANNLLLVPRTFGAATGITLMVEASRDPARVASIVRNSARYLLFVVFPVHLGAAAITAQAIRFAYTDKYTGAIPVLIIAAVLAIPRAFQEIPEVLLRTADKQRRILIWVAITGVVNVALDWYLIPRYGAVGAAWGNGLAQIFGIVALWQQARQFYNFRLPLGSTVRLFTAASIMAVIAWQIARNFASLPGLILAVATAVPVYILLVRALGGLEESDRHRLTPIGNKLPAPARRIYMAAIAFLAPAAG